MMFKETLRKERESQEVLYASTREGTRDLGACDFRAHRNIEGPPVDEQSFSSLSDPRVRCCKAPSDIPKTLDRMVDSTPRSHATKRQAQLKRLVDADYEDEIVIAEARKRIKMRRIQHESLQSTLEAEDDEEVSDANYQADEEVALPPSVKQEQDDHDISDVGKYNPL